MLGAKSFCLSVIVALGAAGCGSSEEPSPDARAEAGPLTEAGGPAEAGVDLETDITADAIGGPAVLVVIGEEQHVVDLSRPEPVDLDGTSYARLSDVVQLAFPEQALSGLAADFEAGDGFRPSQSPNCVGLTPVAGEQLARGYVHPTSRNLRWDDELAYPGCMRVKDLAAIYLSNK